MGVGVTQPDQHSGQIILAATGGRGRALSEQNPSFSMHSALDGIPFRYSFGRRLRQFHFTFFWAVVRGGVPLRMARVVGFMIAREQSSATTFVFKIREGITFKVARTLGPQPGNNVGLASPPEKRQGRRASDLRSWWPACGLWAGQGVSLERRGACGHVAPQSWATLLSPRLPGRNLPGSEAQTAWKADWLWSDSHSKGEVSASMYGLLASLFPVLCPHRSPTSPSSSVSPRSLSLTLSLPSSLPLTHTHTCAHTRTHSISHTHRHIRVPPS